MFKRITLFAATLLLAMPAIAVETGEMAPAFTADNGVGTPVSFPELVDGKPTVMLFWATWCPYCKAFMPYLEGIQKDYGEDRINVLLINHKERGEGDPVAYIESLDFANVSVIDGERVGDAYEVAFLPGLMIADADGRIAWKRESTDLPPGQKVGEFWDAVVREQLDKML